MAKKTNKTSHVLNLITNGGPPEAEEAEEKEEVAEPSPQEPVAVPEAPSSKEANTKSVSNGDKTVIVVNETSQNDKISSEIRSRLTDQLEEEAVKEEPVTYCMVNVMEQIIKRQGLDGMMKQYGVCPCSRCKADVMALSLTNLPAKYVVMDSSPVTPIIGYYESKFKVRILTEIIKSCIAVKESPRHDRSGTPQFVKH